MALWWIAAALSVVFTTQLALAAPPDLALYGKLPGIEHAVISPVGDKIAMVGIVNDSRTIVVVDDDANVLYRLPIGDTKVRGIDWAGENAVLVYRSNTKKLSANFIADKAELYGMTVLPIDGGKSWSIFQSDSKTWAPPKTLAFDRLI